MPSESLPPDLLQQIDRICDDFEGAWRAGNRPRIEDFLDEEIAHRDELLRELIARELELKRAAGEAVDAAHYEQRFESNSELVRNLLGVPDPGPPTAVFHDHRSGDSDRSSFDIDVDRTDADTLHGFMDIGTARRGQSKDAPLPSMIGRFRTIELIGQGNFLVYRAREERSGREYALKVARPDDPFSRRRFTSLIEEAQRLASLDHPGIVKVHEFVVPTGSREENQAGGDGFIVLEYVEGQTLETLLHPSAMLPISRLAQILAAVADAVHYAHLAGLVHRDLKPSNVLIDAQGEPRVCDFGLAVNEELLRIHRGQVAGTMYYMAPEQVRGETHLLDGRTDIWALGVILYRGLTGRLPFNGANAAECFGEILARDPRPPRQTTANIPGQLERICLRCLSKPISDRYLTAADLAVDLRRWLYQAHRDPLSEPTPPASPKGLRTFGFEDAGSFLTLLPGPRGPDGLPESIRFWKSRIEDPEAIDGFRVGLVYGPSGGGKSSFVRAGLLPQLDRMEVRPIYVEAGPVGTEARLLEELRRVLPRLPVEATPAEAVALIRDDPQIRPREKILLVVDHFEQWLQGRPIEPQTELVLALRQCDGRRVQALLVVRDDFWMATTRLFHGLDIPLVQGANTVALDLLDVSHARRVLEFFGRSLGRISPGEAADHGPVGDFLDQAVKDLAGTDGRVIPIRLSLFVEVVRHRPWNPETLAELGGIDGIEIRFLELSFDTPHAPPAFRSHRDAARAVLQALLPAPGANLHGPPISGRRLRQASRYADRPFEYGELLRLLEHDLRLIRCTENPLPRSGKAPATTRVGDSTIVEGSFQLAHDFLIRPVRHWIERESREHRVDLRRGWPSSIIRGWFSRRPTDSLRSTRNAATPFLEPRPGQGMKGSAGKVLSATRRRLWRPAALLAICVALLLAARAVKVRMDVSDGLARAYVARPDEFSRVAARLVPHRDLALRELVRREASGGLSERDMDTTRLLLYRLDPTAVRASSIRNDLLSEPDPARLKSAVEILATSPNDRSAGEFRRIAANEAAPPAQRLRAACALVALEPGGVPDLSTMGPALVRALQQEGIRKIPGWLELLETESGRFVGCLARLCREEARDPSLRITSAEAVAELLDGRRDTETLARVMLDAQPDAAAVLLPTLVRLGPGEDTIRRLASALEEPGKPEPNPDPRPEEADRLRRRLTAATALWTLGRTDPLWRVFGGSRDARLRELLIEWLARTEIGRDRLVARLGKIDINPSEREAILLIWDRTPHTMLPAQLRSEVLSLARRWLREDPDARVHAAAENLARKWSQQPKVGHG